MGNNKVLNKIDTFISIERSRFTNRHNNLFAFSFSQLTRYYEFIIIILDRHRKLSKEFVNISKTIIETFPKGSGSLNQDQIKLLNRQHKFNSLVHLEIESFYLFSKIILDKVAHAIEFYFGQVNRLPLDSHDDLYKNLERYSKAKGLVLSSKLINNIRELKLYISNFRDYEIAHEKSPRTIKGTAFDVQGKTRISMIRIYPTKKDQQIESKTLEELIKKIDDYILLIIDFITNNRDRTNLEIKDK